MGTIKLKITLVKPLILDAVKSETFLRGQIEKSADQRTAAMAYHEQAGDEEYQERLLQRGIYTNLSDLETHLTDYLSNEGGTTGDNSISYTEVEDTIVLILEVTDRFNKSFTDPLAKLCSKYIEDAVLMDWWKPINEKQSSMYSQFVERDLAAIKRCFIKRAPSAPTVPYTKSITIAGTDVELTVGESKTITYALSDGAIDDIECSVKDSTIVSVVRVSEGLSLMGLNTGHTPATLYSRHDPDIKETVQIFVEPKEGI